MEKEILEVRLKGNCADTRDGVLRLGCAQSYGIYRLHITADEAWQGLAIAATFDCGGSPVTVVPAEDGLLDVPAEATASANTSCHPGSITFWGSNGDVRRVSARLLYRVYPTGSITGGNAIPPTPEVAEQLLARLDGKLDTPANTGAAGQVPVLQPDGSTLWGSVAGGTGTGGLSQLATVTLTEPAASVVLNFTAVEDIVISAQFKGGLDESTATSIKLMSNYKGSGAGFEHNATVNLSRSTVGYYMGYLYSRSLKMRGALYAQTNINIAGNTTALRYDASGVNISSIRVFTDSATPFGTGTTITVYGGKL